MKKDALCILNFSHTTLANKRNRRGNSIKKLIALLLIYPILFGGCRKVQPEEARETAGNRSGTVSSNSVTEDEFTIAVIPDTQYYVRGDQQPGILAMFTAQTQWIVDNKTAENIAYVIHLGDITDNGDNSSVQYPNAAKAMYKLDTAGIGYGIAVGNHDQSPNGALATGGPLSSTTNQYNATFGVAHFTGKSFYGGHYSDNNDSHYDLFSAGGLDFIVIYIEFDARNEDSVNMNTWAYNLLGTYSSRKAIIVTHNMGPPGNQSTPSVQAQGIYERLKSRPNVFMFLGGHVDGEGYRKDTYNGKTIKTFISDYQFRTNGGDGYMRLMKISKNNDLISVKTYSPYRQNNGLSPYFETDSDSQFTKSLFHEQTSTRTCDFNNNGKTELAFFNVSGTWKVNGMANSTYGAGSGFVPVPADYDGDGKTDLAVWNTSSHYWGITTAPDVTYGDNGSHPTITAIPIPADYNGDGKADVAVVLPNPDYYWGLTTATDVTYGITGDIPVPADYNGDGKADVAVWRPSTGNWHVKDIFTTEWGTSGDIPVPGDYNGDGKGDLAIYRRSTGQWYVYGQPMVVWGGNPGDIPAPGDYFGDGKTHLAYYRSGKLYIKDGATITLGGSGDKIVNLPYHIRKFFFP